MNKRSVFESQLAPLNNETISSVLACINKPQ